MAEPRRPPPLLPRGPGPVRVGFYDIEGTLGKGNFAVVKLARHRITRSEVRRGPAAPAPLPGLGCVLRAWLRADGGRGSVRGPLGTASLGPGDGWGREERSGRAPPVPLPEARVLSPPRSRWVRLRPAVLRPVLASGEPHCPAGTRPRAPAAPPASRGAFVQHLPPPRVFPRPPAGAVLSPGTGAMGSGGSAAL